VRDTGVGISREQQRLIFGAFTQADSSTTRRFGGTGLGLAIASQLVQLMGGRLWVESGEGVGSTFHFEARLPLAAAAGGPRPSPLAALDGLPVLVVDDNHSRRGILERMLRQLGMRPAAVEGGEQALGALRQLAAGETPVALVLLDATLPGMDGFALARAMRLEPGLACGIVLMLSSLNEAPAAALCQELGTGHGYTVYLRKPVVEEELVAAIRGALGIGRPPGKHPEACVPTLPPLGRRRRILLAEDNSVTRRLVAEILAHRGHVVETTSDGAAAVAALEREAFDLVLMDVGMPVVDGLRATRAIRERELEQAAGRHVPILALTAHALKGDHERCLAAGMDGYISKPITVWQLLAAVEDWAGERTAPVGDAIVASPLDESVARPTSGAVDHLSDQPLSSAVRERVAGPTNKTDMESQE
jgi:CheY-like chemotaxis protein